MNNNPDQIKQAVMDHYGTKARKAAGVVDPDVIPMQTVGDEACCATGDDDCCAPAAPTEAELTYVKGLYAQDEVEGLPEAVLEAVAGCGNPTAIAQIRPGEVVLDLGSGGGIDCFLAARQTGPDGHVIGVDMTPDMLSLARRNASELGLSNVEFRQGEIESLPVDSASVDLIISNCVVNLSTVKDRTLREAFRVLKPGGRLRISDMVWRERRPEGADSIEEWSGCIAGAITVDAFIAGLTGAGFVAARADSVRDLQGYEGLASALISAEKQAR